MADNTYTRSVNMGDNNNNCNNIIGSFNKTINMLDEDAQIMRWISPLEPQNRHQGVRTNRFDGVGDWLLKMKEFREWRTRSNDGGTDKAVLFCSGNPGVGKTYVSSLVIDSLCDQARTEDIAVACLYCDFLAQQDQTITNMIGAILKQLLGRGGIPEDIREAYRKGKTEVGGRGLRLPDLMGMLKSTISSLPQTFICIDALDECLPRYLPELLESLRDIVRESPTTRIFLTGRPHVGEDIQRCFAKAVMLPISPDTDDIRSYLEMKLAKDPEPDAMSDDLRTDIMRIIPGKISDVFLLVSLNIDAILAEITVRQRRKKLEEMTQGNGLSDAYKATLSRVKAQKGSKSVVGMKVLMWMSHSERPLRADELCRAMGVEIGSADLDLENVPTMRTLLGSCLGLVTVEESSSTVRLIHFTLQDFLSSDPTLFGSPHSSIAEVCLTYLNSQCIRNLSPTLRSTAPTIPLLEYASCHWVKHAAKEMTEEVKTLAVRLLDGFEEHISAQLVLWRYEQEEYEWLDMPYGRADRVTGFTGLHGAASFGLVEIFAAVLRMKEWDVNAIDGKGSSAFIWAARRGHEGALKVLLEREDVNPNTPDTEYGRTPLYWGARRGHSGVVKTLLAREDVNPNTPGTEDDQTPLCWAARNGHDRVVKMLLAREDVNPNTPDTKYGLTPLCWAARNGHEVVITTLLAREDVNPNTLDTKPGGTPLCWAAHKGHQAVVKTLLAPEDVNPNSADTTYVQTPLYCAAGSGHDGTIKMLLAREDVNSNTPDTEYGRTPLSWAARRGHEVAVKTLLAREDVNPNTADTWDGRTPLCWGAGKGHEVAVKTPLARKDVNPSTPDTKYGRTPLSWAADGGHDALVKSLLAREDVNPKTPGTEDGRTPLCWAAENGRDGVVKSLLAREDVDPNTLDTECGRTPLCWAAVNGHEAAVKALLAREDVIPNTPDTTPGRTPLLSAALCGHVEVVKIFLEREDVNIDSPDNENETPLSLALSKGYSQVVKMLQDRINGSSATVGNANDAITSQFSGHGVECVMDMQSGGGDLGTDIADLDGQKTLSSANLDEGEQILGCSDSDPSSGGNHLSSTGHSSLPPPSPQLPPKVSPWNTDTQPHNSRSTLPTTVDRYLIFSFIRLLAFLIYLFPSLFPIIFSM